MKPWLAATLLVALGGAAGAPARYWLGVAVRTAGWAHDFPLATFLINVSGSLVLGALAVLFLERQPAYGQQWWLLLGVGFCGAYTTFSTFEVENFKLLSEGRYGLAFLNAAGSVLAGYAAVVIAFRATRWLT